MRGLRSRGLWDGEQKNIYIQATGGVLLRPITEAVLLGFVMAGEEAPGLEVESGEGAMAPGGRGWEGGPAQGSSLQGS